MNSVRFDREEGGGLLLAIDTSGPLCAAGLYDGPVERARIVLDLGRGHAERVIDACTDALRAGGAGWRRKDMRVTFFRFGQAHG